MSPAKDKSGTAQPAPNTDTKPEPYEDHTQHYQFKSNVPGGGAESDASEGVIDRLTKRGTPGGFIRDAIVDDRPDSGDALPDSVVKAMDAMAKPIIDAAESSGLGGHVSGSVGYQARNKKK